jgi:hypothetical protein
MRENLAYCSLNRISGHSISPMHFALLQRRTLNGFQAPIFLFILNHSYWGSESLYTLPCWWLAYFSRAIRSALFAPLVLLDFIMARACDDVGHVTCVWSAVKILMIEESSNQVNSMLLHTSTGMHPDYMYLLSKDFLLLSIQTFHRICRSSFR